MSKMILEKNNTFGLSPGWAECKLSDIATKITDGEHLRPKLVDRGIPFLSAKDIVDNGIIFDDAKYISKEDAIKFRKKCDPEKNDLLIVSRGNVGRSCLVNSDKLFCLLGSVILVKINHRIDSKYLNYYLKQSSIKEKLVRLSGSTVQGAIYLKDVNKLNVGLCPFNEQKRIAAKIEELFSEIDNTKQILEKTKILLKHHGQSLLKSAFEGVLTKTWREQNKDGIKHGEILEKLGITSKSKHHLNFAIPNEWIALSAQELSSKLVVGFVGTCERYYCDKSEGVPMIRTKNLSEDGLMLKDLKYITHNFHLQNKKSQLRHNDILVARHGQNGLSCIYERYEQAQALNVIIFHTNENVLDPKFAVYALGSPLLLNQIGISTAGTVQRVLNTKTFAKLVIPLPPLNEQKQIVSILSKYFSLIKNDETIVNLMLNKLSILKTTILKSAFEGKLVPQDPNDETASVLLERIKQEKEKLQESKKIINIKSSKSWRTKNAK